MTPRYPWSKQAEKLTRERSELADTRYELAEKLAKERSEMLEKTVQGAIGNFVNQSCRSLRRLANWPAQRAEHQQWFLSPGSP